MHRARNLFTIVAVALLLAWSAPVHAQDATPQASTADAEPAVDILLDTSIDSLPSDRSRVSVDRWTLRPSPRVLRLPALGGPVIIAVDTGTITATEGETGHQLTAGQHLVFSGDEVLTFEGLDPEQSVAFVVYLVPTFTPENGGDLTWDSDPLAHTLDYPIDASVDALPGGSGRLLLERLTLPPGTALPAQEVSPLVWYGTGEGRVGIALEGDRLPFRWDPGEEREFAAGESLPFFAPGTQMTLRNADDQPVVLYRLTLTPMGVDAATPMAGTPAP